MLWHIHWILKFKIFLIAFPHKYILKIFITSLFSIQKFYIFLKHLFDIFFPIILIDRFLILFINYIIFWRELSSLYQNISTKAKIFADLTSRQNLIFNVMHYTVYQYQFNKRNSSSLVINKFKFLFYFICLILFLC